MVVPVHDPEASKEALTRARVFWSKSQIDEAVRMSREAVQFDHRNFEALVFRSMLLNEKKQFEEAHAVALQSLQVQKSVEGLLELGRAELYLGRFRDCMKTLFDVEGLDPANKKMIALRKLATTALETGVIPKPKEGNKMDRAEKKRLAGDEKRLTKEKKEQEKLAKQKAVEEEKKKKEEDERKAAQARIEQKAKEEEERKRKEEEEKKRKEDERKQKEEEKKQKEEEKKQKEEEKKQKEEEKTQKPTPNKATGFGAAAKVCLFWWFRFELCFVLFCFFFFFKKKKSKIESERNFLCFVPKLYSERKEVLS